VKEYTLLAILSVVATVVLDEVSEVRILRRPAYYVFLLIIWGMMMLVNGYLTGMMGAAIVLYDPRFFLGIRLITIPIEDFLFGFSMVTMAAIFWEYFKGE
jgi:lycopene cyclase domain-containing protein